MSFHRYRNVNSELSVLLLIKYATAEPAPVTDPSNLAGAATIDIGAFRIAASVTRIVFTLCSAPSVQPVSS